MVDEDGQTTHYLGMHRDVTEVHRLERQVQNQKALIESVVDAAQVAIVLLDENERVLLDNQEYKKLIGDLGQEPAAILLATLRAHMGLRLRSRPHQPPQPRRAAKCCIERRTGRRAGSPARSPGSRNRMSAPTPSTNRPSATTCC